MPDTIELRLDVFGNRTQVNVDTFPEDVSIHCRKPNTVRIITHNGCRFPSVHALDLAYQVIRFINQVLSKDLQVCAHGLACILNAIPRVDVTA
ncbi:hypothetical protein D3C72_1225830 [compost metagenome]